MCGLLHKGKKSKYRDEERPVLINNWEGTYFDFDEEKILNIAKTAKKAFKDNISLKEACVELGFLTAEKFDEVFHPEEMA